MRPAQESVSATLLLAIILPRSNKDRWEFHQGPIRAISP